MDDTEDLLAKIALLTAERDFLIAERERTAPLVAAARAYAEACSARTEAYRKWRIASDANGSALVLERAAGNARRSEHETMELLLDVARSMQADGAIKETDRE